ncbi:hypothetical protein CE91St36_00120 [Christensenellaceae bacterium]|nr:hypothetical protein CE91St36_00120 [Christensenellaceae bacterium]BDF59862.1 hypothetical protein CE91St37_00120 [Christensenellaceae bacterium]
MKEISFGESAALSGPHLFAAIVTRGENGKVNIMGVSWFTFVSLKDGKLLFCTSNKGYTGGVIQKTKNASLCMVSEAMKDKVLQCCSCSGSNTDKTAEFDIALKPCDGFEVPVLAGAGVCWALELDNMMEAGDHTIYVMNVKKTVLLSDAPHVMAFDGYRRLATV